MLDATGSEVAEERSTGRNPLTDAEARALLGRARRVLVVRGRSRRESPAADVSLDQLKGPTGNYRAPILLCGDTLLVGFNAEALDEILGR